MEFPVIVSDSWTEIRDKGEEEVLNSLMQKNVQG